MRGERRWRLMSDNRRDYGPAGCMDGCAQSGGCGCLVMLIGLVIAGFASIRTRKTRKR
jgi:hypothetical protein